MNFNLMFVAKFWKYTPNSLWNKVNQKMPYNFVITIQHIWNEERSSFQIGEGKYFGWDKLIADIKTHNNWKINI
jgi:hypothetical protein